MEIIANAAQTVAVNQNVIFTNTAITGNCSIIYREGSGLVTVRGLTNQCRARYKVFFNGNVAIPNAGTLAPILLSIAVNGESIGYGTMINTPAAVEEYDNVSSEVIIDVPKCCCEQISIKNIGTSSIEVQNANLIIERIA